MLSKYQCLKVWKWIVNYVWKENEDLLNINDYQNITKVRNQGLSNKEWQKS